MSVDLATVAELVGVDPADPRLPDVCAAATAWVQNRRSLTDPVDLWAMPDVQYGGALYGALLWTQRAQPAGLPSVDELGGYTDDLAAQMGQINRLVGSDPVIA